MSQAVEIDPDATYACKSYLFWDRQVKSRKGVDTYTVTWNIAVGVFICTCRASEFHLMCWHIAEDAQPMYCGWSQAVEEDQPLKYADKTLRCPRCRGHVEILSPA